MRERDRLQCRIIVLLGTAYFMFCFGIACVVWARSLAKRVDGLLNDLQDASSEVAMTMHIFFHYFLACVIR